MEFLPLAIRWRRELQLVLGARARFPVDANSYVSIDLVDLVKPERGRLSFLVDAKFRTQHPGTEVAAIGGLHEVALLARRAFSQRSTATREASSAHSESAPATAAMMVARRSRRSASCAASCNAATVLCSCAASSFTCAVFCAAADCSSPICCCRSCAGSGTPSTFFLVKTGAAVS